MKSEAEYIDSYSDFLRKIAAQMDGGKWKFLEYWDAELLETQYFDRTYDNTIIIEKTQITPVLNRSAFAQKCVLIEDSYKIKLPEDYKIFGFWFVKCSCFCGGTENPDLQYFTLLGIHD